MKKILTAKNLSALVISTGVLFISMNTQAEIYKWTDAKGVTHYSSQKPTQKKIKSENIETKIRSAAGKYRPSSKSTSKPKPTTGKKPKAGKKNVVLAGPSPRLVAYCKTQRKNLAQLQKNYRNIWKDKSGKSTRLNQEQRQEKVNNIQKSITEECAGV